MKELRLFTNQIRLTEIIIQIINELGLKINKKCANVLLAAIYTDTDNLACEQ